MKKYTNLVIRLQEHSAFGTWYYSIDNKYIASSTNLYGLIQGAFLFLLVYEIEYPITIFIQYDTGKKSLLKIRTNAKTVDELIEQISKFNEFKTELNHLISK